MIADANAEIGDVLARLGVAAPEALALDRPLSGVLARALGRVPTVGERFHIAGLEITVIDAEPARINRVLITPAGASAPVALELPR